MSYQELWLQNIEFKNKISRAAVTISVKLFFARLRIYLHRTQRGDAISHVNTVVSILNMKEIKGTKLSLA